MRTPRHTPDESREESGEERAEIERALEELEEAALRRGSELDPVRVSKLLRRSLTPRLARKAAEQFALRRRASARFPSGGTRWSTRKGLEQATREPVARARAERIAARVGKIAARAGLVASPTEGPLTYDATCGIGADALALAAAGVRLVAGDRDERLARCARDNLREYGASHARVIVADASTPAVSADFVVLDPDRRASGARSLSPQRWSPSLADALRIASRFRGACLKLPPAQDFGHIADLLPTSTPRHFQWVSCARELCELTLWLGELAEGEAGEREALALDSAGPDTPPARLTGMPREVASLGPAEVAGISWLADPDPSVVRSGLVGLLASEVGLAPLAPGIAYLGGRERPSSPLLRAWRVLATAPADPRRVRAMLAAHDVGKIAVMKRGHPDRSEVLERRFRGTGRRRGLLAIARLARGHLALLLEPETRLPGGRRVGDEGFEPPTSSL